MNRVKSYTNTHPKKLPYTESQPPLSPTKMQKQKNLKRDRLPTNPTPTNTFPTNPLQEFPTKASQSSSNVSGSESTSNHMSLLSHSYSSSSSTSSSLGVYTHCAGGSRVAKTPKSAPVVTKPLIRKKPRFMEQTKLKLKSTVSEKPHRKRLTVKPEKVSVLVKKQSSVSVNDSIAQVTTPVSKLGNVDGLICGSNGEEGVDDGYRERTPPVQASVSPEIQCGEEGVDDGYRERTPPVQASVSPEIQCGSSMSLTKSQACYAAGHLLSGVSDKRKCKPKGILTVGENGWEVGKGKILNDFDELDEGDGGLMPLPVDASVHWLLSPCEEEKDEKEKFKCVGREMTLSPLSASSDLCNISSGKSLSPMSICKETMRRTSSSLSPAELSRFRRFMQLSSCEGVEATPTCEHLKEDKQSPLPVDTLGSENVIQTPESNSSFDNYFSLLNSLVEFPKKRDDGSDLESLTMSLESASLSPRSHISSREPSSSSFNFDSFATSSDSVDLSRFHGALGDRTHVRVSYREETNSHMPEMKAVTNFDGEPLPGKGRELLPCSAAESINTDGGGLICSEDSNWMACYKN